MRKLVLLRFAVALPQLAFVSLAVFMLTYLVPGSPAAAILGGRATPEAVAELEAQLGLDEPAPVRFGQWVASAATGDLGESLRTLEPVTSIVTERLPATLSLALGSLLIALIVGVVGGILAAVRPGTWLDKAVTLLTSIGLAIPEFWLGLILILVFAVQLQWVPVVAYTPITEDPLMAIRGLILPCLSLGMATACLIARQMRNSMLGALVAAPYVDTLRSVGVTEKRIILKYAFKNALIPVAAVTGFSFGILLATSLVVEQVFAIPGLGGALLPSVVAKDLPVVQGIVLVIAVAVISANLLLDIVYGWLDPRARPA